MLRLLSIVFIVIIFKQVHRNTCMSSKIFVKSLNNSLFWDYYLRFHNVHTHITKKITQRQFSVSISFIGFQYYSSIDFYLIVMSLMVVFWFTSYVFNSVRVILLWIVEKYALFDVFEKLNCMICHWNKVWDLQ